MDSIVDDEKIQNLIDEVQREDSIIVDSSALDGLIEEVMRKDFEK